MVSKFDVFYVVASKAELRVVDIVDALNKPKDEYQNIFNRVRELENDGFVGRNDTVKLVFNDKSKKLFRLISFCVSNGMNYNLLFKETVLNFLQKAVTKEIFSRKDIGIHAQTFNFYVSVLAKYGFLLVLSRKPLKCKLLRHHFIVDLLEFFNKKAVFYTPKKHSFISNIKKELQKYKRNLRINYTVLEDIENKEEISFIYASLNLEGNPLTLPETQKLLMEEIVPEKHKLVHVEEVTDYKKTVDLMRSNAKKKLKLDLQLILNYHRIAMAHIHGAGEIRRQNVKIKLNPHFKTCEWPLIHSRLEELMEKYSAFEKAKKKDVKTIIDFAAFFHNEFQHIHPFVDGNSRLSRLLMFHILRSNDIPVLDFPIGYFDLYLNLTKLSKERDDKAFQYLIEELVFFNLKRINSGL